MSILTLKILVFSINVIKRSSNPLDAGVAKALVTFLFFDPSKTPTMDSVTVCV